MPGELVPSPCWIAARRVDDAGSSPVPACDSLLDSSDPLTVGSQAGTETVWQISAFRAEHQRQHRPVHSIATVAGSGVNRDGVCEVGEYRSSRASKVAAYLRRVVDELLVAPLRS